MKNACIFVFILVYGYSFAQSDTIYSADYINKSTKFAWLTYGGDLNLNTGGRTQIINSGISEDINFGNTLTPRLTIGGIHFWGHTDFYVTFPLSFAIYQNTPSELNQLEVLQGVETGTRIYPLKLKPNSFRPFVGISFRRIRFAQEANTNTSNNGVPYYSRFIYPIQLGVTYSSEKWHISASGYYNYQNTFNYFIDTRTRASVELAPISFNLSFLRYSDTDRGMRSSNAVQKLNRDHARLKSKNKLSSWFFGIGPSAALQTSRSSYLKENHPYFYDDFAASILPDFSFGRYFHKSDLNLSATYRAYKNRLRGYNSEINTRRQSIGIESVKFLFNYLGFVPFIGPVLTHESLSTTINGVEYNKDQFNLGITFGWDIRVTRTGSSLLRTNLRYFPGLNQDIEGEKMMFDHLEFNFIQWVYFIGRNKALSN